MPLFTFSAVFSLDLFESHEYMLYFIVLARRIVGLLMLKRKHCTARYFRRRARHYISSPRMKLPRRSLTSECLAPPLGHDYI